MADNSTWKILTVDDISSSSKVIEFLLEGLSFQNKKLLVLTSSSLEDAKNILKQHSDIALLLVDIMMENKDSGLEFISFIRNNLKNNEIRIILRTGYPDSLPEKEIIQSYEIDGYIPKEINSKLQLEVAIITAIRNYHQIITTKESLRSLAGSIAHELRNPLNAINLAQNQIKELLTDESKNNNGQILELNSHISDSVTQAGNTINIILADLGNKPIEPSDFSYLSADKILPEIIKTFGYSNLEEKEKVKLDLKDNFVFKAVTDRFTFIIYNLLKNALYYLNQYPDSVVTIGIETIKVQGKDYNSIYVQDTGPGIPDHIIPKLFGDFYTSGKKEGTGLGLSFCKRNMKAFGGDIICESEERKDGKNGWTKFSLLFPKLSEEEIKKFSLEKKKKKILLVDDQEVNLLTTKSRIEQNLANIICDIALSGKEAINMTKQNKYQLILMDIQMPEMNGIEATKKIRAYDKETPIIAFTSLDKKTFLQEIGNKLNIDQFSDYLNKVTTPDNILYRTLTKWMIDVEDDLSYLGSKEDYLKILHRKKIILADDQQVNLLMTRRNLEGAGMLVSEAANGKELVEIYQKSLDENGRSNFDAIITDINMEPYDGDKAAKEIRAIESSYQISHHNEIPIIALTGDSKKEDINHFFDCQITDYFVKGSKPEILLKIIANYLIKTPSKIEIKTDSTND